MPEVIFPGPEGRLEGRYHPQKESDAPIAIILHPHPQFGGTMNNKVVYNLHYAFYNMGFTVMRFNFRGVGASQGSYDTGTGLWTVGTLPDVQFYLPYGELATSTVSIVAGSSAPPALAAPILVAIVPKLAEKDCANEDRLLGIAGLGAPAGVRLHRRPGRRHQSDPPQFFRCVLGDGR